MNGHRGTLLALIVCLAFGAPAARADGGRLRLWERAGGYQVSLFTSPTPFRAGPVDVSLLVQDAATGEHVPQARVTLRLSPHGRPEQVLEYPATAEAATNKLFHAAQFELTGPGRWDVEVRIEGPLGPSALRCELEAAPPLPRWLEMWPWIAWPALVVVLFAVHQVLVRRQPGSGGLQAGTSAHDTGNRPG
jgi:hypothetical protein